MTDRRWLTAVQPIYWPDKIPTSPNTYQKAADSITLAPTQGGHPESDLAAIFSKPDRVADYQHYATDAIGSCLDLPDMGAQVRSGARAREQSARRTRRR